jgi:hypothetical protein
MREVTVRLTWAELKLLLSVVEDNCVVHPRDIPLIAGKLRAALPVK